MSSCPYGLSAYAAQYKLRTGLKSHVTHCKSQVRAETLGVSQDVKGVALITRFFRLCFKENVYAV